MNIWKRGFLFLIRKPVRSCLLIALVYCSMALVVIGISASYTSGKAQRDAKNQVGASFQISLNMEDYYQRIEDMETQGYNLTIMPEPPASQIEMQVPPNFDFVTLYLDDIEKLAKVDGIKDYNIEAMMNSTMRAVDFKRIEGTFTNEADVPEITVRGVRDLSLLSIVQDGSITLVSGRWIEPNDSGKIVISEELAQFNQLEVGDVATLETVPMKDTMMLEVMERQGFEEPNTVQIQGEIVGVFKNNRSIAYNPGVISQRSENQIFTDLNFPKIGVYQEDPFYETAIFYVAHVDDMEEIQKRLEAVDINWNRYILLENNQAVEEVTPAFQQLKSTGELLLSIVLISSFMILTIGFIFLVKGRNYEIGIWLSLGKSKWNIVGQILWEGLIMLIVSLVLCIATKSMIVGVAEEYLNKQGNIKTQVSSDFYSEEEMANLEDTGEVEEINLTVTIEIINITAGICLLLMIVATLIAVIPIMKMKPREIFTKL